MPKSAKSHLIAKLRQRLEEVEFKLYRGSEIPDVPDAMGATERNGDTIEVAVGAHKSVDELVHTVIHELLHDAGYKEEAVDEALDRVAYASPSLRGAVAMKLLGKKLRLPA